jgi:hypothetical protein
MRKQLWIMDWIELCIQNVWMFVLAFVCYGVISSACVCVCVWFRKRKRNEFVSSKVFMQLFQDKKVQESIFCIRMEWCERREISKPKVSEREGVGITMWDHERQTEREEEGWGNREDFPLGSTGDQKPDALTVGVNPKDPLISFLRFYSCTHSRARTHCCKSFSFRLSFRKSFVRSSLNSVATVYNEWEGIFINHTNWEMQLKEICVRWTKLAETRAEKN